MSSTPSDDSSHEQIDAALNSERVDSTVDTSQLVREGDIAGDYIERLLDILDSDGDIDLDVEGDRAVVAVVGERLSGLIGPRGATLEALQELTRLAVAQQTGARSRLMLDIGDFRANRRAELERLAQRLMSEVRTSGEAVKLSPMNPFERKIVHDVVSTDSALISESEGDEPGRRVVIIPANA
ncbi:MAG: protein jag [Mycobacteriales bacterium]